MLDVLVDVLEVFVLLVVCVVLEVLVVLDVLVDVLEALVVLVVCVLLEVLVVLVAVAV